MCATPLPPSLPLSLALSAHPPRSAPLQSAHTRLLPLLVHAAGMDDPSQSAAMAAGRQDRAAQEKWRAQMRRSPADERVRQAIGREMNNERVRFNVTQSMAPYTPTTYRKS